MEQIIIQPSIPRPSMPREEVRLNGERETWHWCRHFHCSEERLREAIDRVGPDPEALRRELL